MSDIKGYRILSDDEKAAMNECKELAITVGELVERLQSDESLDQRWIATGKTDLQKGFMSVIRGIAQPTTF
jgi:hypothetical protein